MMKHGSVVVVLAVVAACGSSTARPGPAPVRTGVAPPQVVAPPVPREDPVVYDKLDSRSNATRSDYRRFLVESPDLAFNDQLIAVLSGNHLRRRPVTVQMLDEVDLDRALAIGVPRPASVPDAAAPAAPSPGRPPPARTPPEDRAISGSARRGLLSRTTSACLA